MGYCTAEEFELSIGTFETVQLTNLDDPSAETINTVRLNRIIEGASGEINGFLATRYQIPLPVVPSYIRLICIDITWYRLAQNNAPAEFVERYKNAIARLKDIEKGQMLLIDEITGLPVPKRNINIQLIDERGNTLNDWSASTLLLPELAFTRASLELF